MVQVYVIVSCERDNLFALDLDETIQVPDFDAAQTALEERINGRYKRDRWEVIIATAVQGEERRVLVDNRLAVAAA